MAPGGGGQVLAVRQTSPEGAIDLPADMQRELRDLESRGNRTTYYELIGVAADADGGAIRRAYLEKSKRFHPDAWYRKELGEFGPLLSKWFQRLAAAYQSLSDEESRADYDAEHKDELNDKDRRAMEKRELSRTEQDRRQREGRERLLRAKGFARIGAARKLYEDAQALAQNGERTNAIAALKAARELDPNRKEIASRLVELEREQSKARSLSQLAAGHEIETKELWDQAVNAYSASFQNDPANFAAALGAARCSLELGETQQAANWGGRAVEVNPRDPEARMFLARVFKSLNMKARARAELTALLTHEPGHKEAKALLKGL